MRPLALSILFFLSSGGRFTPPEYHAPFRFLWVVLFGFLSTTLLHQWIKRRPPPIPMEIEGLSLALLFINAVSQETGGIQFPLLLCYIVVILLSSLYLNLLKNMIAITGILFLEGISLFLSPPPDGVSIDLIFFPFMLTLIPLIVRGHLRTLHRESEALQSRDNRIKDSVASLEPLPEIHEKVRPARLSERLKRDETLLFADRMEADLENLLQVVLSSHPGITRSVVLLYNHKEEHLWVRAARGRGDQIGVDRQRVIRLGEGIIGWIAKEPRTVSIADLRYQNEGVGYDDGSVPIRSLLVVPILNEEVFEGLVCVDSVRDHLFSSRDEQLVQLVTKEILRVLKYFRGQQRLREQTKEHATLLEITKNLGSKLELTHRLEATISSAKEIIDYDTGFIFLIEPGERRMTVKAVYGYDPAIVGHHFPLTNGLLSLIVKNRQGLFFSKTLEVRMGKQLFSRHKENKIFPDGCKIRLPSHSFLGLPMVIDDRVIGVVLFSSDKEGAFTTYNRHVLSIMCNHVAVSIAEAQAHAQVERLATMDGLTGLLNHRRFQERLAEMFVRVSRHPEPFSLLMIDIDHFKKINDTFGHPAGDAVIKKVSNILKKLVRKLDIVARYGGEEFVILLVKSDSEQALRMAERIRKGVETNPASWKGGKITATVSIGISGQPEDAVRREELVTYADRALYASKQSGRNRTTLYKDVQEGLYEVD